MNGSIRRGLENLRYLEGGGAEALARSSQFGDDPPSARAIAYYLGALTAGLGGMLERLADDEGPAEPCVHDVYDPEAGRKAYEAYRRMVGGRDFRGDPLVDWDELATGRQAGWKAAAAWYHQ